MLWFFLYRLREKHFQVFPNQSLKVTFMQKIVETTFVSSRFSGKWKETTSFPLIATRNNKKLGLFLVISARTTRNEQNWTVM